MVLQVSPLLAGRFAGRYQLNIGLNGRFRENLRGLRGSRVGLFGEWKSEDSFHIRYAEFEGPDAFEIRARFEGRRLVLSVDDPSGYFGNHKMIGRAGNSPIRDM